MTNEQRLREALERIAAWDLPPATTPDVQPSRYEIEYGSNGARDYIRSIARQALSNSTESKELEGRPEVTGPDEFGSVYIYLNKPIHIKGVVGKTVKHTGQVNIDYDRDGNIFGIELLDVNGKLPPPPSDGGKDE